MSDQDFSAVEDFVFDASFRDWVLHNESVHKEHWEKWLLENPAKNSLVQYAKSIVYALSAEHKKLSEQEIDSEIRSIMHRMRTGGSSEEFDVDSDEVYGRTIKRKPPLRWIIGATAAAAILALALFYFRKPADETIARLKNGNKSSVGEFAAATTDKINNADTAINIELPDHSTVILSGKSTLVYDAATFNKTRIVHLKGEAFFQVRKMPSVPFLVYSGSMVTKVLGTSFRVKEFPGDKKASVIVRTGKVSVHMQQGFTENEASSKQLSGLIVIPNQQVTYDIDTKQLTKNIIDKPILLAKGAENLFAFNSTPLKEVFATLEHAYGITIMYDETMINSCSLSVTMDNETFYEKLDLICKAINARYESIDGSIFITSHGCK